MPDTIYTLETPAVLVDLPRLERNIHQMQAIANRHQLQLRPHAKTHKSLQMAGLQIKAGAVGLTTSKVDEALVFIEGGIPSVLVAYPILDARKLQRLLAAATAHHTDLRLMVDSMAGKNAIVEATRGSTITPIVFLKVNVGLNRCGVNESDPTWLDLARALADDANFRFGGMLAHAGHAYGKANAEEVHAVAEAERVQLLRMKTHLEEIGVTVPEISVGSTPTVLAAEDFMGITEIRPGNAIFMDRTPLRLKLITLEQIALTVLATIVSQNADYFIIDAGSKVLSSDKGAHGVAGMEGFGLAMPLDNPDLTLIIEKLSEEHGFIPRNGQQLPPGTKFRIYPNHACVVANLAESYTMVDGEQVIEQWQVDAQGCVR